MQLPFISGPNEITNDEYNNGEKFKGYLSSTKLKDFLVSPKYFRYKELNPEPDSIKPHFMMGSIYHDMLAAIANTGDIESFRKHWLVFEPPKNESTGFSYGATSKKYAEAYEAAKAEAGNRELCSQDDVNTAYAMIGELIDKNDHLSKDIRFLLRVGKAEVSHFCVYEDLGYKHRTDLETKSKIVDWKTCPITKAHPDEVSRQIINFNYHISGAFYQFFDYICTGTWKSFFWVFQEKEPPYDFIIESADNWCFEITRGDNGEQIAIPKIGATMFLKYLELYQQCRKSKKYPGYSIFIQPGYRDQRIHVSVPPGWYKNQVINFFN